jgi:hypothetical protein
VINKYILCIFLVLGTYSQAQITLIPDPQFENYLITIGIDSDGTINGQVFTSDIDGLTYFSIVQGPLVTDLTGIEDFTSLEILDILSVDITEIDISNNLNLKKLDIDDVSLTSLDISHNTALEEFHIGLNSNSGFFTSTIDNIEGR